MTQTGTPDGLYCTILEAIRRCADLLEGRTPHSKLFDRLCREHRFLCPAGRPWTYTRWSRTVAQPGDTWQTFLARHGFAVRHPHGRSKRPEPDRSQVTTRCLNREECVYRQMRTKNPRNFRLALTNRDCDADGNGIPFPGYRYCRGCNERMRGYSHILEGSPVIGRRWG